MPVSTSFGELDDLNRSSSDAADSSSGVHEGEDEADFVGVEKNRVARLAIGSSRWRACGTCELVMGPITADAGGDGSGIGSMGGVRDSGRREPGADLGNQDEMEGRRVLGWGKARGGTACVVVRRLFGLSTATSIDKWGSWSPSFDSDTSSHLRFEYWVRALSVLEHRKQPRTSNIWTFSCNSRMYATTFSRISSLNSFSCLWSPWLAEGFFLDPDPNPSSSSSSSPFSALSSAVTEGFRPASAGTSSRSIARASFIFARLAFSMRE